MTEEQIKHGYDRLDGALAPPLDAEERVAGRVTARRRHRRTAVAGVATLGVLAVGGTVVALASGNDGSDTPVATDPGSAPVSTLVLTRPDGSTYAFEDVTVSCTPPRTAAGDPIAAGPDRIWMYSPIEFTGSEKEDDVRATKPFVYFEGIVSELQGDRTLPLPVQGPEASDTYPLTLFMADTEGAPDGNEVTSAVGDATGTVRVLRAACEPTPVLELEVDATLGSEEGKNPLDIAGSLH
jgi:hypothetical protein